MSDNDNPAIIVGSREQLLHLLAEASEIEHTLMCSYLYAAFSLKRRTDDGLSKTESEAVERWRKAILAIAVQEMGHLLMVANITVAIGGQPHFTRPNFPVSPGYFPSGVVVRLSGFSTDTLDHFIFLERPEGTEVNDGEDFQQPSYERRQAINGLMPSAQDYATIGHLYEATRQNLTVLASQLGEKGLFIGSPSAQVGSGLVSIEGVAAIHGLRAALDAIDLIVEQGEGSPSDREESHYKSFLSIRTELALLVESNPSFTPAWPVANNPVLRRPPEPDDKVFISEPAASELLDFACAAYGLLLRTLVHAFARSGARIEEDQELLVSTAFTLMHVVGIAASRLATLPANIDFPGVNAGISFTMLRGVEPFLRGKVESQIMEEQLALLAAGAGRVMPGKVHRKLDTLAAQFRLSSAPKRPGS